MERNAASDIADTGKDLNNMIFMDEHMMRPSFNCEYRWCEERTVLRDSA